MRVFALASLALAGCGPGPTGSGFSSGPAGSVELPDTASTGSPEASSTDASSTTSTSSPVASSSGTSLPDAGTPPDFGQTQPEGCNGKIDFLFVIARYTTMLAEQQALLASFDGFIASIEHDFADFDSHIMVANPDGEWSGKVCESHWCPKSGDCGPNGEDYVCGAVYDDLCDIELGAGILYNAGQFATNHECELVNGRRYIVTKEEPDLATQFECIASVGISGPDTPMMKAIAAAVAPEINADEGCNAGFLRPDALLVIVMIMDTYDDDSFGTPTKWFDAVVAAKGGDPDAVVMVAILNPLAGADDPPDPDCFYDPGDEYPNPLRLFAEKFPHRVMGSHCAESYAPAFAQAATVVQQACGGFIPR